MTQCPKCGCWQIFGPYYKSAHGVERLKYQCSRCGYQSSTATLDAKEGHNKQETHREQILRPL